MKKIIVVGYPKSGCTWVTRLVAETCCAIRATSRFRSPITLRSIGQWREKLPLHLQTRFAEELGDELAACGYLA